MNRREVAAWLGCSEVTEEQAREHCRKQGLNKKETAEFMKAFAAGKADWAALTES